MRKNWLLAGAALLVVGTGVFAADNYRLPVGGGDVITFGTKDLSGVHLPKMVPVDLLGASFGSNGAYPPSATPITISATGTTLATAATLPANATKTTYICGFAIRANATAAATGNATVAGTISGTMNFTQWTAPLASGIGLVEQRFVPCIPASAVNTTIVVTSAAPGAGGTVSTTAWGYQL